MAPPFSISSLALANNLILAPMAGITDLPVRLLARDCGAGLCFTEMISVNGLVRDGAKTFELLRSCPEDRPLGIQLFGDDPDLLAEGARIVEGHGDLIDINMGCPVKKVVGTGAGSALLRDPGRIRAIVRAVRKATAHPLTIKIRTGWQADDETYEEVGRIAADEGCDAITLHPRTRAQMFDGHAEWDKIEVLKRSVPIPVIGSGDVFTAGDAVAMLARTGCDGVMIARGGLGNPWIFREVTEILAGGQPSPPTPQERMETALRHVELLILHAGEKVALREMRKHLAWYAKGLPGVSAFRAAVNVMNSLDHLVAATRQFFSGKL